MMPTIGYTTRPSTTLYAIYLSNVLAQTVGLHAYYEALQILMNNNGMAASSYDPVAESTIPAVTRSSHNSPSPSYANAVPHPIRCSGLRISCSVGFGACTATIYKPLEYALVYRSIPYNPPVASHNHGHIDKRYSDATHALSDSYRHRTAPSQDYSEISARSTRSERVSLSPPDECVAAPISRDYQSLVPYSLSFLDGPKFLDDNGTGYHLPYGLLSSTTAVDSDEEHVEAKIPSGDCRPSKIFQTIIIDGYELLDSLDLPVNFNVQPGVYYRWPMEAGAFCKSPTTADAVVDDAQSTCTQSQSEAEPESAIYNNPDLYMELGEIASGAYGEVLAAKAGNGRLVAIKAVNKKAPLQISNGYEALLQEKRVMQLASDSQSRFLTPLLGHWETKDYFCLVMDWYAEDLERRLHLGPQMSPQEAKLCCAEMLYAVHELHSARTMHRDIKPENFFIDHDGHIVLGDFGLSHTPKPKMKFEKAPTYGLCGTSSYLAPELLNDALLKRHGYKYKVDIFSLGVTFVEVLGRLTEPLYYAMDQDQQRAVMNDLGVDIVRKFIKDPDQLDLVLKMIDENPNRRPSTQEIMKHAFFKDIDWEMVYNHQYQHEYTHPRFRQNSIGMQSNP